MLLKNLFPLLTVTCLTACGKWEPQSAAVSPDGKVTARVEYKGSAACCSDHSRLSLTNARDDTLTEPGVVVKATKASIKAHWASDDLLVVEACGATAIRARSEMLREPVVKPDGSINAIRLQVVTSPMALKSGASYCSAQRTS